MALGNILRVRKEFTECADVYGKGIATLIRNPQQPNWLVFYFRGICHERSKQWASAEADFKKALELSPDQPHVLNYLGYSWIDQGVNLDEGMRMIRRAVEQRPDDGYIVDSLGWAYYRIGEYDEAVKHLERAVELKPDDPTINDHLGDAYWKIGRTLEATFQWAHARDLKPEPEELKKIVEKLRTGLVDEAAPAETAKAQEAGRRRLDLDRTVTTARSQDLAGFAPAKVNLTLHVLGRRADGYHELESLVVFADVGDRLTLRARRHARARRARPDRRAAGATRRQSRAQGGARARRARRRPAARPLHAREADCRSRPASAAARPMRPRRCACWRAANGLAARRCAPARGRARDRRRCAGLSRSARAHDARHRRDPVRSARHCRNCPRCWSIRASRCRPGTCSPRSRRRRCRAAPQADDFIARRCRRGRAGVDALRQRRNDLEAPAIELQPVIADVLAALARSPGCLLARMSGSGATCFGLFGSAAAAAETPRSACGARIRRWWVDGDCGFG